MKLLIIFLISFLGCIHKNTNTVDPVIDSTSFLIDSTIAQIPDDPKTDTIYIIQNNDSLLDVISKLKKDNNRLKDDLFISNYRVERARYYLKIVKRNPSQLKFMVSWMNRALY